MRWMPANCDPEPVRRHNIGMVHIKRGHRGAPDRGLPDKYSAIVEPGKVLMPTLRIGMEQRRHCTGLWINGVGAVRFVAVAKWTG